MKQLHNWKEDEILIGKHILFVEFGFEFIKLFDFEITGPKCEDLKVQGLLCKNFQIWIWKQISPRDHALESLTSGPRAMVALTRRGRALTGPPVPLTGGPRENARG